MKMHSVLVRSWQPLAATFVAAGCVATYAQAQSNEPLTLTASYTLQSDSNLFRRPTAATEIASENIGVGNLGLEFKSTQSLQTFELRASVTDYKYQNFSYLNFAATNYTGAWRWAITPRWVGNFSTSRSETANSFADFTGTQANLRTDINTRLDTSYEIDGPWRIVGAITGARQTNQLAVTTGADNASTGGEIGLRYDFGTGSTLTYVVRVADGEYLNRTVPNTAALDKSFRQLDHDMRLRIAISGNSSADAYLTALQRTHPTYTERDYSGFNTGATLNMRLSGKTTLAFAYSHQLAANATANSNYNQTDSLTITPVWQVSPKLALRLQHQWSQLAYMGSPGAVVASNRSDVSRNTLLGLNWQPYDKVGVSTSWQRQSRGSNIPGLDFDATLLSVNAVYSY